MICVGYSLQGKSECCGLLGLVSGSNTVKIQYISVSETLVYTPSGWYACPLQLRGTSKLLPIRFPVFTRYLDKKQREPGTSSPGRTALTCGLMTGIGAFAVSSSRSSLSSWP